MLSKSGYRVRVVGLAACAGAVGFADADTIRIKNTSNDVRVLSDLYAFSEANNKGTRTTILVRGDATDDVNIASGGTKNYTAPNGTDSFTVSWMVNGKEVESDLPERPGTDVELAMFVAPGFGGELGVAFDAAPGLVPREGFVGTVVDGVLVGSPEFEWFSFYDTTSSDGFIERDDFGVPMSPRFSGSVAVAGNFVVTPAPASVALLGLGGLVAGRRRR